MNEAEVFLTTRQAAAAISAEPRYSGNVSEWQLRRLLEFGDVTAAKFGGKWMVRRSDLPQIVEALRRRGWLPQPEEALATA